MKAHVQGFESEGARRKKVWYQVKAVQEESRVFHADRAPHS